MRFPQLPALALIIAPFTGWAQTPLAAAKPEAPAPAPPASVDPSQPPPVSTTLATVGVTPSSNYLLRPNDFIRISVFQEDDLLTEARISKEGIVNFPLLGPVHLSGHTVAEAVSEIRTRLDKDYIINPQVTLTIIEYDQQCVTVLGEVQRPGQIPLPPEGGLDLLGAIALAGGYTRVADPSEVIVRRESDGHDQVLKVDARRLARDVKVSPFLVQPGDRISVAESIW
jgi:polysaccharide export outer membrane protein